MIPCARQPNFNRPWTPLQSIKRHAPLQNKRQAPAGPVSLSPSSALPISRHANALGQTLPTAPCFSPARFPNHISYAPFNGCDRRAMQLSLFFSPRPPYTLSMTHIKCRLVSAKCKDTCFVCQTRLGRPSSLARPSSGCFFRICIPRLTSTHPVFEKLFYFIV